MWREAPSELRCPTRCSLRSLSPENDSLQQRRKQRERKNKTKPQNQTASQHLQRQPRPSGGQQGRGCAVITLVESRQQLSIGGRRGGRGRGRRCSVRCLCSLMMDWMRWSLTASPPGSVWPARPQDASEALALTTALGYSLLGRHTRRLSCCFHPVSIRSRLCRPC